MATLIVPNLKRPTARKALVFQSFLSGLVLAVVSACLLCPVGTGWAQQADSTGSSPKPQHNTIETITVTASRINLIGIADTASQGEVTQQELDLRPVFRVGQLLETMPGLVVTIHSGEGKANQYLLRGFNLDHGTDIATFVDDMPVNRPTNAHGQGYSDLNFVMPELLSGVDYTKGPYYAEIGDFGAVGSEHMKLLDDLPSQISASVGTLGDEKLFAGGTVHFENGSKLLAAVDLSHLDGPFSPPADFRKMNLAARYSQGSDADG
jgi:outer membrane receptor protein involved in Fe transport